MKKTVIKYLFGLLTAVCVLLFFGAIGGVENDTLSLASGILYLLLSLFGSVVFGFITFVLDM